MSLVITVTFKDDVFSTIINGYFNYNCETGDKIFFVILINVHSFQDHTTTTTSSTSTSTTTTASSSWYGLSNQSIVESAHARQNSYCHL